MTDEGNLNAIRLQSVIVRFMMRGERSDFMKVIKVGAVWCNGCLVMKPRWAEIEKELDWLSTEYYDFDTDREIVEKYKIESGVLPVFIFLNKAGEEILRLNGEVEKEILMTEIMRLRDE